MLDEEKWWENEPKHDDVCANCGEIYFKHRWMSNISEPRKHCRRRKFADPPEKQFWKRLDV